MAEGKLGAQRNAENRDKKCLAETGCGYGEQGEKGEISVVANKSG
ncbi:MULTISPECIES: hypothetical protein [unclassified Microbulbifer]|nr:MULTISPECIES: hypothetical protein [unclassified Microbulbifer]